MEERLLLSLALIGLGLGAYQALRSFGLRRAARSSQPIPGYRRGRPAILYFTTPNCQPCRTTQRPALERVRQRSGDRLQLLEIDASRQTRLADAWGVLSIPTTFLIDAQGRPRGVNHGIVSESRLLSQLAALGEDPPDPSPANTKPVQARE